MTDDAPASNGANALHAVGSDGASKSSGFATIDDLSEAELCYAPQFGSAKDPITFCRHGWLATSRRATCRWRIGTRPRAPIFLDVRETVELALKSVPDAVDIPIGQLRPRIDELPKDRAYSARILSGDMLSRAILLSDSPDLENALT